MLFRSTQAMRAWRDDRLLFNLKLLVDVFAVHTQLASTVQCLHGTRVKAMVNSLKISFRDQQVTGLSQADTT